MTVGQRIGSTVTPSGNTQWFMYMYICGDKFHCFGKLTRSYHSLTKKPVEGTDTWIHEEEWGSCPW